VPKNNILQHQFAEDSEGWYSRTVAVLPDIFWTPGNYCNYNWKHTSLFKFLNTLSCLFPKGSIFFLQNGPTNRAWGKNYSAMLYFGAGTAGIIISVEAKSQRNAAPAPTLMFARWTFN
jgi:hypothetical protein